jgi:hypothetical protein
MRRAGGAHTDDAGSGRPSPALVGAAAVLGTLLSLRLALAIEIGGAERPSSAIRWPLAWAGLDLGLAAAFAASALLVRLRSRWLAVSASATAAMLVSDAWFDCATASGTGAFATSLAVGLGLEAPLAAFCLLVARGALGGMPAGAGASLPVSVLDRGQDLLERARRLARSCAGQRAAPPRSG